MSTFLWPRASYDPGSIVRLPQATTAEVETAIGRLFATGHPVALSSGRAGLALILTTIGLNRPDLVRVPPFASHCVLEAVSRVATPLPAAARLPHSAWVMYHQWGHVQQLQKMEGDLIEDACDSFYVPGSPLFSSGGRFELWSLPKILGCSGGGVVWCRDAQDARRMRSARDSRGNDASLQWLLRRAGTRVPLFEEFWSGRESNCGGALNGLAAADVLAAIDRWPELVEMRRERLSLLVSHIPSWLARPHDRLPCAIPLAADPEIEKGMRELGITTGVRHFERILADGSSQCVKTLPLPVHQDVELSTLHGVLELLASRARPTADA